MEEREIGENDGTAAGVGFEDDEGNIEFAVHVGDGEGDDVGDIVEIFHVGNRVAKANGIEYACFSELFFDFFFLFSIRFVFDAESEEEFKGG